MKVKKAPLASVYPSVFFNALLVPYPKPRTYFPRQFLADGRDLNAARCPAWPQPHRPRPCSGPFVLLCAVGLGQRAMEPLPDRCLFTLLLLSPFCFWRTGDVGGGIGSEMAAPEAWRLSGGSSLALSLSVFGPWSAPGGYRMTSKSLARQREVVGRGT